MDKKEAREKLVSLKLRAIGLMTMPSGSRQFKKWHRDTEVAIERIFGESTRHAKDFTGIQYSPNVVFSGTSDYELEERYRNGVESAVMVIDSFIDEINDYWSDEVISPSIELDAIEKIKLIINRFHLVSRQFRMRYSDRPTIEIEDEYDVQDLFHGLLKLYFDDIRPEEYTPSYAGSASRVDFLLKQERLVIEIKKTRNGLKAKEVGEQLIIDSRRYQAHPDCDQLVCFVYDPEGRIANPRGLENDLTSESNGIPILVFIRPEE